MLTDKMKEIDQQMMIITVVASVSFAYTCFKNGMTLEETMAIVIKEVKNENTEV